VTNEIRNYFTFKSIPFCYLATKIQGLKLPKPCFFFSLTSKMLIFWLIFVLKLRSNYVSTTMDFILAFKRTNGKL